MSNACAGLQGRDEAIQAFDRVSLRLIVEDAAEEIDVCVFDGLIGEKAVGHVCDARAESLGSEIFRLKRAWMMMMLERSCTIQDTWEDFLAIAVPIDVDEHSLVE